MDTHVLSLSDVGLSYRLGLFSRRKHWALRGVDLDVEPGETLGVIGRNGSGKSTLLRVMAGIYAPDEGSIESYGNRTGLLALRVGFQELLSGRSNAILSARLLGLSASEVTNLLPAIIEFSGLGDAIEKPLRTYSSGMRARLGFSVAYHSQPDILMIDEVLGVGDEEFKKRSRAAMHELISSNRTVILVSHQLSTIRELSSRVLWLEKGQVAGHGRPHDVLLEYRDFHNLPGAKRTDRS